ncbi:6-bladed beta-propeller [Lunatimonas salinarum]|uniref:6-bladed beta-propeller n=1 Tax=Lunatimonas salinarum TaxID=1774590 RepID=UPI001ADEEFA8|nr:6-bladed beta-propeller [Lunatimonas salinarum]
MKVFLYLSAFSVMASCGQEPSADSIDSFIHLPFEKAEDADIPGMTEKTHFIKLDNSPEAYFTDIAKLTYKNDKFYIMETFSREKGVLEFDGTGTFIQKIGEIGEGPGMMRRPTDFEVLGDGTIVFLDRDTQRLFFFDPNGEFKKTQDLPFSAISIKSLSTGDWLFSANVQGDSLGFKVIMTDSEFMPKEYLFPYSTGETYRVLSYGNFPASDSEFLYHRPVSDSLFLFGNNGELRQVIKLDFGKEALPLEAMYDLRLMTSYKNKGPYYYLNSSPVLTEHYIVGTYTTTFDDGGIWLFSRKSGKLFRQTFDFERYTFQNINRPITTLPDHGIVSHIMPEFIEFEKNIKDLPQEIRDHLAEEGHVLVVHYLKVR